MFLIVEVTSCNVVLRCITIPGTVFVVCSTSAMLVFNVITMVTTCMSYIITSIPAFFCHNTVEKERNDCYITK